MTTGCHSLSFVVTHCLLLYHSLSSVVPLVVTRCITRLSFYKQSRLLLYVKNWVTFYHFFHLSFPKALYKSVLLFIIKVPYKSVLLSIITCHPLSLTYHTQNYFIKAFFYLAKTWLCITNFTIIHKVCHSVHWGITPHPVLKNITPRFLAKEPPPPLYHLIF